MTLKTWSAVDVVIGSANLAVVRTLAVNDIVRGLTLSFFFNSSWTAPYSVGADELSESTECPTWSIPTTCARLSPRRYVR